MINVFDEKKLERPEDPNTVSKEQFAKMGYQERLKLYNENPDQYKELSGHN